MTSRRNVKGRRRAGNAVTGSRELLSPPPGLARSCSRRIDADARTSRSRRSLAPESDTRRWSGAGEYAPRRNWCGAADSTRRRYFHLIGGRTRHRLFQRAQRRFLTEPRGSPSRHTDSNVAHQGRRRAVRQETPLLGLSFATRHTKGLERFGSSRPLPPTPKTRA